MVTDGQCWERMGEEGEGWEGNGKKSEGMEKHRKGWGGKVRKGRQ